MAATTFQLTNRGDLGGLFRRIPRWAYVAIAVVLIAAIVASYVMTRSSTATDVVTQPVMRETLAQTVTASGTVNAQNTIAVGTQVSGTIASIDVDYNSHVKKGQVLARLDPSSIQAQLDQAQANVAQASAQAAAAGANAGGASAGVQVSAANSAAQQAAIGAAQANTQKAQAALTLAQQTLQRDQALYAQGYLAKNQIDSDNSNVAQSQAAVAQAQASAAQAQAQAQASAASVTQQSDTAAGQAASAQAAQASIAAQQAVVQQDQLNLQHTVITSPVDGVVVARSVSVGQTVAASLQTPTLFTIAQDLKKMEVDINVAEPDIGNVKAGDNVTFTVLAYPNQQFSGKVDSVRINPTTTNNVVTYQVVVYANNSSGKLLPGMTANATIDVASAPNALVVPLQALHTRGGSQSGSTQNGSTQSGGTQSGSWGQTLSQSAGGAVTAGSNAMLLVQRNGKVTPVRVHVDLTTAAQAAVTPLEGQTLSENDVVVISSGSTHASGSHGGQQSRGGSSSPFAAQAPGGMRGMGGH